MLALGHRDAIDGKAGAAIQHVSRAIASIEKVFLESEVTSAGCALKLLGDLYSFGALLPPDVFMDELDAGANIDNQTECLLKAQASFVAKGEMAYRDAAETPIAFDENDANVLRAAMLCDMGGNMLLQGQLLSSAFGEGQGSTPEMTLKDVIETDSDVKEIYERSAHAFKNADRKSVV